jgi:hypothetical protein
MSHLFSLKGKPNWSHTVSWFCSIDDSVADRTKDSYEYDRDKHLKTTHSAPGYEFQKANMEQYQKMVLFSIKR